MRAVTLQRAPAQNPESLAVRGGVARTFGSFVGFLATLFLGVGLYLLGDVFLHPLSAGTFGVLAAALSITLAAILLYYRLKPVAHRASG